MEPSESGREGSAGRRAAFTMPDGSYSSPTDPPSDSLPPRPPRPPRPPPPPPPNMQLESKVG